MTAVIGSKDRINGLDVVVEENSYMCKGCLAYGVDAIFICDDFNKHFGFCNEVIFVKDEEDEEVLGWKELGVKMDIVQEELKGLREKFKLKEEELLEEIWDIRKEIVDDRHNNIEGRMLKEIWDIRKL